MQLRSENLKRTKVARALRYRHVIDRFVEYSLLLVASDYLLLLVARVAHCDRRRLIVFSYHGRDGLKGAFSSTVAPLDANLSGIFLRRNLTRLQAIVLLL